MEITTTIQKLRVQYQGLRMLGSSGDDGLPRYKGVPFPAHQRILALLRIWGEAFDASEKLLRELNADHRDPDKTSHDPDRIPVRDASSYNDALADYNATPVTLTVPGVIREEDLGDAKDKIPPTLKHQLGPLYEASGEDAKAPVEFRIGEPGPDQDDGLTGSGPLDVELADDSLVEQEG